MSKPAVVPFPLCRRHKLVHNLASVLRDKHGDDADMFWRSTAKDLLRQLVAVGVSMEAAQVEVRGLLSVVVRELRHDAAGNGQRR